MVHCSVKLDQDVKIFGGRAEPRGGRQWQAGRKLEEAQGGATCATATTWDQVQEPPWLLCDMFLGLFSLTIISLAEDCVPFIKV